MDPLLEFLFRDVSVWGDVKTPMLSWAGSCGIVLFFLWQQGKFLHEVYSLRQPFSRVRRTLRSLVVSDDRASPHRFHPASTPPNPPNSTASAGLPIGIDRDSLEELDESMTDEPIFKHSWTEFRKSLLIDH